VWPWRCVFNRTDRTESSTMDRFVQKKPKKGAETLDTRAVRTP
jgi:hypothetical protein